MSGAGRPAVLELALASRLDVQRAAVTSTGRAGMTLLLKAFRRLAPAGRDEVILPTYTCYSVAASAIKAGLRIRLVDISPETLDYDPDALSRVPLDRALAIVATNLYGIPNDLAHVERIANGHGVFVVDDAAQALGARLAGRTCGTRGDAGLFSFDKGKNVCAIDGGVVATSSSPVAEALAEEVATLSTPGWRHAVGDVVKAVGYSVFLRPSLYWIPARVPQLELGRTVFTTEFLVERPTRALGALAHVMLDRLDTFTAARRANAQRLIDGLCHEPGVRLIRPHEGAEPAYVRLPFLARDASRKDDVIRALNAAGIGATGSYPASLLDVPEVRAALADGVAPAATGGREVAASIVTIPTHPFVSPHDTARMLEIVGHTSRSGVAAAEEQPA